jgi:hypothetical protein
VAELRFPVGDLGDDLATELGGVVKQAVADGQLADTDAPVVRELGMRLILNGARTFENALDRLEGLGAAGQRQWLDDARQSCGLPTATELERRRGEAVFARELDRLQPPGPPKWSPLQRCPECGAYPGEGGSWKPVTCEKWWCDEHRHLAAEGDLEEHEAPYVGFSHTGKPIPSERERARLEAWYQERRESEERERRKREEHDEAVAETIEAAKQHYIEQGEISVMGVRTKPDLRIIE